MQVHIWQRDGHERDASLMTEDNATSAAHIAAFKCNMQAGDRADVCITSYDPTQKKFVNRIVHVSVMADGVDKMGDGVYIDVNGEPRRIGMLYRGIK